jgi:cobalt-zinc-cadmium efflux system outer membrane protein
VSGARRGHRRVRSLVLALGLSVGGPAAAASYGLEQLLALAAVDSPLLAVARADELAAQAGITTARAWPNPEFELGTGHAGARAAGNPSGSASLLSVAQPLENPWLREARVRGAEARVDIARAQTRVGEADVRAVVRRRYYDALRLREELQAHREDLALTEQIRQRVQVRAATGEAPRFDVLRADGEVALARKNVDMTRTRLRQALQELKLAVGPALEDEFELAPPDAPPSPLDEAAREALRAAALGDGPDGALARREAQRAERQVEIEQQAVLPQVTLRATREQDPSATTARLGAQLTIPLWNRRQGPIAEARALAERARLVTTLRQFEVATRFDAAWHAYQTALVQVQALDGGVIGRARAVVEVAEAAYRFGERGILDYLDAQRQFRLVRNEAIQARANLNQARVELERLAGG